MGAPARATGGVQTVTDAPGRRTRGAGREEGAPPRGGRPGLPKPPQGHSGFKRKSKRRPPRREGTAPAYSNQNSKELMLAAAREVATERGYEAMRIAEITDPIGVTRQAFYAHFRDKRHCMCEAIDPKLGAIERMAASLAESDEEAAGRIAHALDDLIGERFTSVEGTRGRLVSAMIELLRSEGSFHKVRIGALVKAAHVPPGDFYRQFSGKGECFAVAYERLLGEVVAEAGSSFGADAEGDVRATEPRGDLAASLRALAGALNADPERRRILVVEMAHLRDQAPEDIDGARKGAFRGEIAALIAASSGSAPDDPSTGFAAASALELIRSAELAGETEALGERLAELGAGLPGVVAAAVRPVRGVAA